MSNTPLAPMKLLFAPMNKEAPQFPKVSGCLTPTRLLAQAKEGKEEIDPIHGFLHVVQETTRNTTIGVTVAQ